MADETLTAPPFERALPRGPRVRRLTVVHPPEVRQSVFLRGGRMVIGRKLGFDAPPIDDPRLSREHCAIEPVQGHDVLAIQDLGSKNGTFLEGRRIEREYLEPGAVLRMGETLLVYSEAPDPRDDTRTLAVPPTESLALALLHVLADSVAAKPLPVLLTGPTGAGKEVLARRLHESSGRRGPLVAVNCAAFPRELLAGELFGHVAGAFSGAHGDRAGLFASAHGGTLFLDEIGDLPLEQQPALLRALQERRVRPLGSDAEIEVDARVVSATNLDLESLAERGQFRADLIARLAPIRLVLPGLSERKEEILSLWTASIGGRGLTLDAAEALLRYAWPRNVRELQSAAEEARLLAGEGTTPIDRLHLPERVRAFDPSVGAVANGPPDRDVLIEVLTEHRGNVAEVARVLGQTRQTVYRWMSIYRITAAQFRQR